MEVEKRDEAVRRGGGGRDAMRVTLRSAKLGMVEWSAMCVP